MYTKTPDKQRQQMQRIACPTQAQMHGDKLGQQHSTRLTAGGVVCCQYQLTRGPPLRINLDHDLFLTQIYETKNRDRVDYHFARDDPTASRSDRVTAACCDLGSELGWLDAIKRRRMAGTSKPRGGGD